MHDSLRLDQQERWQRGERVVVEMYLRQHPTLADDRSALVDLIYGEVLLREARGEQPNLDEYLVRFPHCANELRRQFAVHQAASLTKKPATTPLTVHAAKFDTVATPDHAAAPVDSSETILPTSTGTAAQSSEAAKHPESYETIGFESQGQLATESQEELTGRPKIPGFEVLGELGRGGMGVVYKARQLSADRLVALKVVRNDVLETLPLASRNSTIERFQQEAQAAAKLEHDNVVTVFEVGNAGGLRYYAMRFVEGRSLYDMLRDGPLDNRRAAHYMEPVCRGLHYAHQRGILHRDLKPHNILVDEHTDRPMVADFGLAKFMERRDELTHAGDVMGTPSYMSPEQAQDAGRVTASADVYSLGATLYHLLTLRPPFQAANIAETIRQIIYEEPVSPRQLNPAIDQDLETICVKCLQKEPAKRYDSAELLADDLRRYLNGEPILARPISVLGRTWRWCRRKPVLAGLIATATSLALVALVAIVVGYRNTSAALAKSELRLQQALQVVNELFTRVSEDELLNEPGMQPLRKDLLERALKHYQYFLVESGGNPAIQDEVAAARFRVGLISQAVSERDVARREFDAARALQQQLLKDRPQDVRRLKALADTLNALGSLFKETKSLDEATTMYSETETLRAKMVEQEPTNSEFQRLLANARMNLGMVEMSRRLSTEARNHMEQAQRSRLELLAADPDFAKARRDLAMGSYNLATLAMTEQNTKDSQRHLRDSIQQFEKLVSSDARSLANRYNLAIGYRVLGGLQADAGAIAEALVNYEAARSRLESLAVGNPDVAFYQVELANLNMNLAGLYDEQNDLPSTLRAWGQVLTTMRSLLHREARNSEYRLHEATALSAIGNLQMRNEEFANAAKSLTAARDRLRELLAEKSDDEHAKQVLEETLADLAALAAKEKGGK